MRQFTEATGGRRIVPQRIWAPKLRAFACAAGADAGTVLRLTVLLCCVSLCDQFDSKRVSEMELNIQ
jgi:hypothetical protein